MGLVFYKNTGPNNWFCEPNRLFQIVNNGYPVVSGANPPMKEFVERGGYGISIDTDGTDVQKIIEGIKYVLENYNAIKQNIEKNSGSVLWESQEPTIKKLTNLFLGA